MSDFPPLKGPREAGRTSLLVVGDDASLNILERVTRAGFDAWTAGGSQSLNSLLEGSPPDCLLVVCHPGNQRPAIERRECLKSAARFGIPLLVVVVDRFEGSDDSLAMLSEADDWFFDDQLERELSLRVSSILNRRSAGKLAENIAKIPTADSHFFRLVAHDLRSPLNVIGLSLRLIGQAVPEHDSEIAEDIRFIEENVGQIERIVTQIIDYFRLYENAVAIVPREFSPRRIIEELIATRPDKPSMRFGKIDVIARDSCPEVVELDSAKASLAISYVLANATAAAGGAPIQLILSRSAERLRMEAVLEIPPPASVSSTVLLPLEFTRICGVAAERRGMDLAIAARVSELFGGWARLDVQEHVKTNIVMEWPLRFGGT